MKKGTKKGPNFSSNTEKRDPELKKRTRMGPILDIYITRTLQLLVYLKDAESHILRFKIQI